MMESKDCKVEKAPEMTENVGPESHKEPEPQYLIDPEDEKRVLSKLDRVILPLMALVYFFQCTCTNSKIGVAQLNHDPRSRQAKHQLCRYLRPPRRSESDRKRVLVGHLAVLLRPVLLRVSSCLFDEPPAHYQIRRRDHVSWIATRSTCRLIFHSVLWGVTEMCLGATADFPSLGAVRFLLGFTEGAVSPSFMIITSNWYKRSENPVRIAYVSAVRVFLSILTPRLAHGSRCSASLK